MATARTLLPGEVTATQVATGDPYRAPQEPPRDPAEFWVRVAERVIDRLGKGPTGHVRLLWLAVGALTAAFGAHLVGDGTVKAKASRTECLVEFLVERELARDRGEPPPPFSPLACSKQ